MAVEAGSTRDGLFICCCLIAGRSPFSKRQTQHPVHADSITGSPDLKISNGVVGLLRVVTVELNCGDVFFGGVCFSVYCGFLFAKMAGAFLYKLNQFWAIKREFPLA